MLTGVVSLVFRSSYPTIHTVISNMSQINWDSNSLLLQEYTLWLLFQFELVHKWLRLYSNWFQYVDTCACTLHIVSSCPWLSLDVHPIFCLHHRGYVMFGRPRWVHADVKSVRHTHTETGNITQKIYVELYIFWRSHDKTMFHSFLPHGVRNEGSCVEYTSIHVHIGHDITARFHKMFEFYVQVIIWNFNTMFWWLW